MSNDALAARWDGLLGRLTRADPTATGRELIERWAEPHRRYHDLAHLTAVLDNVHDLAGHAPDLDAVRLAAWYHDAVYAGAPDDEENSARLAEADLTALGLSPALVSETARLVRLTASHDPAFGDHNGETLCDADLAYPRGRAGRVRALRRGGAGRVRPHHRRDLPGRPGRRPAAPAGHPRAVPHPGRTGALGGRGPGERRGRTAYAHGMTPDPTVPTAVGQVALLVRDIDATVAFYRDALGLGHFGTWGDLAFFTAGATRLFCSKVEEDEWKPLSPIYLTVADLDGAVARLEQAGLVFIHRPSVIHTHEDGTEEWMAFLNDPAGNTLGLMMTRQGQPT